MKDLTAFHRTLWRSLEHRKRRSFNFNHQFIFWQRFLYNICFWRIAKGDNCQKTVNKIFQMKIVFRVRHLDVLLVTWRSGAHILLLYDLQGYSKIFHVWNVKPVVIFQLQYFKIFYSKWNDFTPLYLRNTVMSYYLVWVTSLFYTGKKDVYCQRSINASLCIVHQLLWV